MIKKILLCYSSVDVDLKNTIVSEAVVSKISIEFLDIDTSDEYKKKIRK